MEKTIENFDLESLFNDFAVEVIKILGDNLKTTVIYGSVALGDFAKGKGDIDFLCIVEKDLTDQEIKGIQEAHDAIRNGSLGELGVQLEGAYYTLPMVKDIKNGYGRGYYLGTNRKGWKEVSSAASLNYIDISMILRYGIVIAGEDPKEYIDLPTELQIRNEFVNKLTNYIDIGKKLEDIGLSIEMVYFCVRGLNTILVGDLLSKSMACKWFSQKYSASKWSQLVEYISQFRYPLAKEEVLRIDKIYITRNATKFLEDIYSCIGESID